MTIPSPTGPVDGRFGPAGPPPVVGTFVVLHPGCTLRHANDPTTDVYAVVLAGRVRFTPSSIRDVPSPLAPWSTVALHASSVDFTAEQNAAGLYVLVATSPAPSQTPPAWDVGSLRAQEDLAWAGGAFHARIFRPALASPPVASMEVLLASRDAQVLEHDHPDSWEVLAPLLAAGRFHARARNPDGTTRVTVQEVLPGQVQYVPPGVRHAWDPAGTAPLLALQSYTPPGPETRFEALAHPDAGAR